MASVAVEYHKRRASFFGFWRGATSFGTILSSALTALAFVAGVSNDSSSPIPYIGLTPGLIVYGLLPALVATLSCIDVVCKLSERHQWHLAMRDAYSGIVIDIQDAKSSDIPLNDWIVRYEKLAAQEPELFNFLWAECYNYVAAYYNLKNEQKYKVGLLEHLFRHYLKGEGHDFKPRKRREPAKGHVVAASSTSQG